jgi:hypothetical protein
LRRIMLVFTMIALVAAMVTVSALSGTAQESGDQYDEDQYRSKADPPGEDDSPPVPEPDPEPVCLPDWLQDWYIWEDPQDVEDWWYFYWYKWCYDPAEEEWFVIWDGWEWWGPA